MTSGNQTAQAPASILLPEMLRLGRLPPTLIGLASQFIGVG